MLSSLCETFQVDVDRLDRVDDDYPIRLTHLARKLANDAVELIADYPHGEPVALVALAARLRQWLKSEREDPDDRQRRYGRGQALLDLLVFCQALAEFHGGSAARQREPENLADHRARIADALRVP